MSWHDPPLWKASAQAQGCRVRLVSPLLFDWRHSTERPTFGSRAGSSPTFGLAPCACGSFHQIQGNLRSDCFTVPLGCVVSGPQCGALAPAVQDNGRFPLLLSLTHCFCVREERHVQARLEVIIEENKPLQESAKFGGRDPSLGHILEQNEGRRPNRYAKLARHADCR